MYFCSMLTEEFKLWMMNKKLLKMFMLTCIKYMYFVYKISIDTDD